MDNKSYKNQLKVASSSYPPRSSNSKQKAGKPHKQRTFRLFMWGVIPFCSLNKNMKNKRQLIEESLRIKISQLYRQCLQRNYQEYYQHYWLDVQRFYII